jgi:serine protease Do
MRLGGSIYLRIAVVILAGVVPLAGCVGARDIQRYPSLTPVVATPSSRSIAIYRIVSGIATGAEIGTIQAGVACVGQGRQFWKGSGDLEPAAFTIYAMSAREEFRKAGYLMIGDEDAPTPSVSLFQPPSGPTPDLLVAAVIRSAATNVCYPWAGFGNTKTSEGEASMEVEWQVFEPASQRLILTRTVGGHGTLERGDHGPRGPMREAFAASARNLLADGHVAILLSTRTTGQQIPPHPHHRPRRSFNRP